MCVVHVLGANPLGLQIAKELTEDGADVTLVGKEATENLVADSRIRTIRQNVNDVDEKFLDSLVQPNDVAVVVEYDLGSILVHKLLKRKVDVLVAYKDGDDFFHLKKVADEAEVTLVNSFGLCPGLTSAIIGFEHAVNSEMHTVNIFSGSTPVLPEYPHYYSSVVDRFTYLDEVNVPIEFRVNGEMRTLERPLEEVTALEGSLVAIPTEAGLGTLMNSYKDIENIGHFLIRDEKHAEFMLSLKDANFFDGTKFYSTAKTLIEGWKKDPKKHDKTIVEILIGFDDYEIIWQLDEYQKSEVSSEIKLNACAITSVVNLMLTGSIDKGLQTPEAIGRKHLNEILEYLESRDILFERDENFDEGHL